MYSQRPKSKFRPNPNFQPFGFQAEIHAINLSVINPNGSYVLAPFAFRFLEFGNWTTEPRSAD